MRKLFASWFGWDTMKLKSIEPVLNGNICYFMKIKVERVIFMENNNDKVPMIFDIHVTEGTHYEVEVTGYYI